LVLGLELSPTTNFESLALALALKVKSLALALRVVLGLGLGLEQKSLALAKQVLGLAGLVISQTNNTATMLKSTFIA